MEDNRRNRRTLADEIRVANDEGGGISPARGYQEIFRREEERRRQAEGVQGTTLYEVPQARMATDADIMNQLRERNVDSRLENENNRRRNTVRQRGSNTTGALQRARQAERERIRIENETRNRQMLQNAPVATAAEELPVATPIDDNSPPEYYFDETSQTYRLL